jgi:predicted RNA-binding Zn-ribbon protein involved in translation (DUF1610 family)
MISEEITTEELLAKFCPLCGEKMKYDYDMFFTEVHSWMKEKWKCPNCGKTERHTTRTDKLEKMQRW